MVYEQAAGWPVFPAHAYLGGSGRFRDVLDVLLKVSEGHLEGMVLEDKIRREVDRLLAQISRADSMIVAVKAGARAEGFVLGLETVGALRGEDAERLYAILEEALEKRLVSLTPT